MRDIDVMNRELKAAGSWVFAGGLHPPSTSTVVRVKDGEALMTDGPFTEGKEHIGGILDHQGSRPGRARSSGAGGSRGRRRCPSRCARSRTSSTS